MSKFSGKLTGNNKCRFIVPRTLTAFVLVVFLAIAGLMAGGCTVAKKPGPAPAPPAPTAPAKKPMPTGTAEINRIATNLANVASRVPGVKKATVVISGTIAYVGLDLKENIEKAKTVDIKSNVADQVKNAEKRLTRVYVTTDVDTLTRLRKIAAGIAAGKPLSTFNREMTEITRRLRPVSR